MKKNVMIFPWFLVLYEIAVYLSMDAYMPALPHIAQLFHISTAAAQNTVTVWMIGALIPQIFIGPLSDYFGRRPILLIGGILYIISSLICAWAGNYHAFLIGRFMQGLAMPTMYIAGYAAVNECFESQDAIKVLARMNAVTILAPAFGPILGGAFLLYFNWQWIFVVLAVLALVTLIGLYIYMPETLTIAKQDRHLHVGKLFQSYKNVCKNGVFMTASFVTFLPTIGLIAWMMAGSFIVIKHFGLSTLDFGLLQGFIFLGFMIGTKLVNKLTREDRNKAIVWVGLVIALLGAAVAMVDDFVFAGGLYVTVICLFGSCIGSGLALPILSRLTLESSDQAMGLKVTVFSLIRVFTGVIGAVCTTLFFNNTLGSITGILVAFSLLAVLFWMGLQHKLIKN